MQMIARLSRPPNNHIFPSGHTLGEMRPMRMVIWVSISRRMFMVTYPHKTTSAP